MGTPSNSAAWKVWRDTTHDTICAFFSLENEPEQTEVIYKRIQGSVGNTCYRMMTTLKCFRTISRLLWGKGGKTLPDDVVIDILSRLSARDILKCRMVCRRWMSLTSTPCFLEHLTGSPPIILLHHYVPGGDLRLYSIDLTPKEPCIKRFDTMKLQLDHCDPLIFGGTCDGLVLLWSRKNSSLRLYICNPFTGRKIMEVAAEGFFFCGIWFHPVKREYYFLTVSCGHGHIPLQYKIFNLRGEGTVVGWYATFPTGDNMPIYVNGSLYNLLAVPIRPGNCIMIFNIYSEKIEFKPHPHNDHCNLGHTGARNRHNGDMCLLEVEGSLGFAHVCSTHSNLQLWILADIATWHWIPRYKLNLNWYPSMGAICALSSIQKGEMLMRYGYRRLFVVNLETRCVRKIDISITYPKQDRFLIATTYEINLVGLNRLASFT